MSKNPTLQKRQRVNQSNSGRQPEVDPQHEPAHHHDTWDLPEIDEYEPPNSPNLDGNASNSQPSTQTNPKVERTSDTNDACVDLMSGLSSSSPSAELHHQDSPDDMPSKRTKRRRSFCNFHYRTTQGGSSSVEQGDDPAMQSPGTSIKALKLMEFVPTDQSSEELDMPRMDAEP